jgi:hypothetical protein
MSSGLPTAVLAGEQDLESVLAGREVAIEGERVANVRAHPALSDVDQWRDARWTK